MNRWQQQFGRKSPASQRVERSAFSAFCPRSTLSLDNGPGPVSSLYANSTTAHLNYLSSVCSLTRSNLVEVPEVRLYRLPILARIAPPRTNPLNHLNITRRWSHLVAAGDPVLRAHMTESKSHGRQSGNDVVGVRGAIVASLVCDVLHQSFVADSRAAVRVLHRVSMRKIN